MLRTGEGKGCGRVARGNEGGARTSYPAMQGPTAEPPSGGRGCRGVRYADPHTLRAPAQVPVLEAYAMTEASHQMCSNPLPSAGPRKPGTVGPAQGGVRVAILDAQNRCGTGTRGCARVRTNGRLRCVCVCACVDACVRM